jgi:homogentisate 1,2-dioxygenase
LANQKNLTRTNEIAVMLDTQNTLHISPEAEAAELKEYWASWKTK